MQSAAHFTLSLLHSLGLLLRERSHPQLVKLPATASDDLFMVIPHVCPEPRLPGDYRFRQVDN